MQLVLHKAVKKGRKPCKVPLRSADFSIAASGRYDIHDITQHIATAKHRSNAERKDSEA